MRYKLTYVNFIFIKKNYLSINRFNIILDIVIFVKLVVELDITVWKQLGGSNMPNEAVSSNKYNIFP